MRQDGWYWVRKVGWGRELGDWMPALWKTEFRSWASVGFSGIPDSEVIVGKPVQAPKNYPERPDCEHDWDMERECCKKCGADAYTT